MKEKEFFHKPWNIIFLVIVFSVLLFNLFIAVFPYPELKAFKEKNYSTRFYDRNDNLIYVSTVENGVRREFTPLTEIPKNVKKIFICAEDKRFYFHNGVDFTAILMALYQNKKAGRIVRGGSTLTMQIVKMMSPEKTRSVPQKLLDMFNALRIEAKLSKNQILELYLNSVPFGNSCEGVTSAARSFYGRELKELSDYEIACLSVIPRRPVDYNPVLNPEANSEKAFLIYKDAFHINKKKFSQVQNDINAASFQAELFNYPFYMPHYISYLQKQAENAGRKLSYEEKTTTDLEVYLRAEGYLHTALQQSSDARITNASLLLINNSDNSVITWIGNYDWFDKENAGQIDGVLVKNQPGSSMKPFLYALAMDLSHEEGGDRPGKYHYSPYTVLADIPEEYGQEELYIPANFNNRFNGPVRLRIALASSLNVPAVDILNEIGVDTYLNKLYELGFDSLKENGKKADLGLALGAGEVSLYEMVNAFSVFARGGLSPCNLSSTNSSSSQVYSSDTAALICSILSDKGARALGFGYSQTFETDYPSIFKTGTSNQYQNIIALGSTPDYTIGVWMGNFKGQTVRGKTGSSLPAYVAKKILDDLVKRTRGTDLEYKSFPIPENWSLQKICSLSGMRAGPNCPAAVNEYVENDTELEICNWHRLGSDGSVQIVYPSEYQVWARQNDAAGIVDYSSSQLKIITPKNNVLYYYSSLNSEYQFISCEVTGGSDDSIKVFYDDNFYEEVSRPFVFKLPVEIGTHTCRVVCGYEEDSFNFEVK